MLALTPGTQVIPEAVTTRATIQVQIISKVLARIYQAATASGIFHITSVELLNPGIDIRS